jgi:hypothetical protein
MTTPNPSFHRTLRIKPRKAGEFKRSTGRLESLPHNRDPK